MKQLPLLILAGTASLLLPQITSAELVVGADVINDSVSRTWTLSNGTNEAEIKKDGSASGVRLRAGSGKAGETRTEFYFESYKMSKDPAWNESDPNEIGFGITHVQSMGKDMIRPNLKLGIGMGSADIGIKLDDGSTTNENFNFNIGVGVEVFAVPNVAISAGIDYIYRNWRDIVVPQNFGSNITFSTTDSVVRTGVGITAAF